MRVFKWLLGCVCAFCVVIVLLLSVVEFVVFDLNYYENQYTKFGVSRAINVEMPELMNVTSYMLSYLKGSVGDLSVVAVVDGSPREFFNDKEKLHMADVRDLFLLSYRIRGSAVIIFLIAFFLLFLLKLDVACVVYRSIFIFNCLILCITLLCIVVVSFDFNGYFNLFHEVFFSNDLWLLDPDTDLLINIVPLGFFIDTALKIAVIFTSSLAILAGIVFILKRRYK